MVVMILWTNPRISWPGVHRTTKVGKDLRLSSPTVPLPPILQDKPCPLVPHLRIPGTPPEMVNPIK